MTSSASSPTRTTAPPAVLAASAAAVVLPLGGPVEPVPVALDELAPLTDAHVAVTARFSGAREGAVAVLLTGSDLLALSGGQAVDAECCRPALEAAAGAFGPCVLAALETVSAPTLLERLLEAGQESSLARLGADPADAVHVAVVVEPGPVVGAADLPAPRRAPVGGPVSTGSAGPGSGAGSGAGSVSPERGIGLLRGVQMEVTAEIGHTRLTVQELLELAAGSVVELDRPVGSPADLLVNGRLFARGEVVVVDEDFAIRITEIPDPDRDLG